MKQDMKELKKLQKKVQKIKQKHESKKLYNPDGNDDLVSIINGDTTNILNLRNVKYKWAYDIFDAIWANNWLPEKTPMSEDKSSLKQLTEHELKAYKTILSFLVFLDSLQTNNLPKISEYITAPDIVFVLTRQTFDEAIHSKSYGWIFNSLFTKKESNDIVYEFRTNPLLAKRNEIIASEYESFKNDTSDLGFLKVVVANYLLEGLYFYNGFQFFHNLASRGLMINTDTQIKYIQRDEIQHCNIFKNIFLELHKENPELIDDNITIINDMFKKAVETEIEFSHGTIGDNILGMSKQSIEDYTYNLANKRLKALKLEQIFEKRKDPYTHLAALAGVEDETTNRANNFEINSIAYKNPNVLTGWAEL